MKNRAWGAIGWVGLSALLVTVASAQQGTNTPAGPPTGKPLRYEEPTYLTGSIYASEHQKLLFRFKREADRSGNTLTVRREFTYPDGKPAARETVLYEGNALAWIPMAEDRITNAEPLTLVWPDFTGLCSILSLSLICI